MEAPATQSYRNTSAETLADVRLRNESNAETLYTDSRVLASELSRPEAEVTVAQAWLLADTLEVRI